MTNKTMMRIDRKLLEEIKMCKLVKEESYASVIKRIIDRERGIKK